MVPAIWRIGEGCRGKKRNFRPRAGSFQNVDTILKCMRGRSMARSIWKGAISFGLVHIPVSLISASSSQGINFDWLDERTMDPVGYKRINKATGKEITKEHIVKGVELEKGRYVVLSEEEIKAANPEATQTIDIFAFVESAAIPMENIHKPYYLSPGRRGEKVYALLREALIKTDKVALANVVVRSRQRLAAVMPKDAALVMMMLRWPSDVRSLDILDLGNDVTKPDLSRKELDMATRLIEDMTSAWEPDEYRDTFEDEVMRLVEEKAKEGEIEQVEKAEGDAGERKSADVVDLTELLKRSLGGKGGDAKKGASSRRKSASRGTAKDSDEEKGDAPARKSPKRSSK